VIVSGLHRQEMLQHASSDTVRHKGRQLRSQLVRNEAPQAEIGLLPWVTPNNILKMLRFLTVTFGTLGTRTPNRIRRSPPGPRRAAFKTTRKG
jgi:hypothetical protein